MTERATEVHYSDEIADEICSRLGDGETLSTICQDDRMPDNRRRSGISSQARLSAVG